MVRFAIQRSFWHIARDCVVLIGEHEGGVVQAGDVVHLPGLGDATVATVEQVQMATGELVPCLTFPLTVLDRDPLFEPSTLDGVTIDVVPGFS